MAMTFTQLIGDKTVSGSIKSWTNYVRVDSEAVLAEAESLLYDGFEFSGGRAIPLRVREMVTTADVELIAGNSWSDLPERYLDPIRLTDKTTPRPTIPLIAPTRMQEIRFYESGALMPGLPQVYAVFDGRLQFEYASDTTLALSFMHYAKARPLSATYEGNFLTERYPRAVRLASCMVAADYMHDDANYSRYARDLLSHLSTITRADDLSLRGAIYEIEVP